MKKFGAAMAYVALVVFCFGGQGDAHAGSTKNCVMLKKRWGDACGNRNSLRIQATNRCNKTVWLKICIKKANGKYGCGVQSKMTAGYKNSGFFVCNAASRTDPRLLKWASCTGGRDECGFKP